jgi:hypothetical protein
MDALRACLMAPLLFTFGVQWALLIDALSFGASFLAILSMDTPPPARSVTPETSGNALNEFLTGLRFFAGNRVLMAMGERRIAPTNRGRNLYVSV